MLNILARLSGNSMQLTFAKEFEKRYKALNPKQQQRVDKALLCFVGDRATVSLRYHALKGQWLGHFSLSAGGDLRIHLKYLEEASVLVVTLGTHSQLYK